MSTGTRGHISPPCNPLRVLDDRNRIHRLAKHYNTHNEPVEDVGNVHTAKCSTILDVLRGAIVSRRSGASSEVFRKIQDRLDLQIRMPFRCQTQLSEYPPAQSRTRGLTSFANMDTYERGLQKHFSRNDLRLS